MTVRIWNAMTGEMEAKLEGHTDVVTSVAFSQDGSRVVSGSRDNDSPDLECNDGRDGGKAGGPHKWGHVSRVLPRQQPSRLRIRRQDGPDLECNDRRDGGKAGGPHKWGHCQSRSPRTAAESSPDRTTTRSGSGMQ